MLFQSYWVSLSGSVSSSYPPLAWERLRKVSTRNLSNQECPTLVSCPSRLRILSIEFCITSTCKATVWLWALRFQFMNSVPVAASLFCQQLLLDVHWESMWVFMCCPFAIFKVHSDWLSEGLAKCPPEEIDVSTKHRDYKETTDLILLFLFPFPWVLPNQHT